MTRASFAGGTLAVFDIARPFTVVGIIISCGSAG
jgi:hypothetical protein